MKKLLIAIVSVMIFIATATAQSGNVSKADKAAEKEAKAKLKQKQTENMEKALKEAGVSDDLAEKFKAATVEFGAKSNEVRKNTSLTEAEKEVQLKAISTEKNAKLTEIIGTDRYKAYNKIKKAQKEGDNAAKEVNQ